MKLSKTESSWFWAPNFRRRGLKFATQFIKSHPLPGTINDPLPNMWESLVAIGRGTSKIIRWKKGEEQEEEGEEDEEKKIKETEETSASAKRNGLCLSLLSYHRIIWARKLVIRKWEIRLYKFPSIGVSHYRTSVIMILSEVGNSVQCFSNSHFPSRNYELRVARNAISHSETGDYEFPSPMERSKKKFEVM